LYLKPLSKRHNYAARRDGGRLNTVEEWPTAGAADSVDGLWSYERPRHAPPCSHARRRRKATPP